MSLKIKAAVLGFFIISFLHSRIQPVFPATGTISGKIQTYVNGGYYNISNANIYLYSMDPVAGKYYYAWFPSYADGTYIFQGVPYDAEKGTRFYVVGAKFEGNYMHAWPEKYTYAFSLYGTVTLPATTDGRVNITDVDIYLQKNETRCAIKGKVVDEAGNAVADAVVETDYWHYGVHTNSFGEYKFEGIPVEPSDSTHHPYKVIARKSGFLPGEKPNISVYAGEITSGQDITLKRPNIQPSITQVTYGQSVDFTLETEPENLAWETFEKSINPPGKNLGKMDIVVDPSTGKRIGRFTANGDLAVSGKIRAYNPNDTSETYATSNDIRIVYNLSGTLQWLDRSKQNAEDVPQGLPVFLLEKSGGSKSGSMGGGGSYSFSSVFDPDISLYIYGKKGNITLKDSAGSDLFFKITSWENSYDRSIVARSTDDYDGTAIKLNQQLDGDKRAMFNILKWAKMSIAHPREKNKTA